MQVVQNQQPDFEDVQPVIDGRIVDTVHDIFSSVIKLNALQNIFEDLGSKLVVDLKENSFMDINLELTEEQKQRLLSVIKAKGNEAVQEYLTKLNSDAHAKEVYRIVREKTTSIVDSMLSAIGQEINRGAVINARAVQANSKNEKYDEILLRKTKASGDITVPTSVIVISTNCVDVIKASCQEKKGADELEEKAVADKPTRVSAKD